MTLMGKLFPNLKKNKIKRFLSPSEINGLKKKKFEIYWLCIITIYNE